MTDDTQQKTPTIAAIQSDFGVEISEPLKKHIEGLFSPHYYMARAHDAEAPDAMQQRSELIQLLIDLSDAYLNSYEAKVKAANANPEQPEKAKLPHICLTTYNTCSTKILELATLTASKRVATPADFQQNLKDGIQQLGYLKEELELVANQADATEVEKAFCASIISGADRLGALFENLQPFKLLEGSLIKPEKPSNLLNDAYTAPAFITRLLTDAKEDIGMVGEFTLATHGLKVDGWDTKPINQSEQIRRTGGAATRQAMNDSYGILYCLREELRQQRIPFQKMQDSEILTDTLAVTEHVTTQMRAVQALRDVIDSSYGAFSDRTGAKASERVEALLNALAKNRGAFPRTEALLEGKTIGDIGFTERQEIPSRLQQDVHDLIESVQKEGQKLITSLEGKSLPDTFNKDTVEAMLELSQSSLAQAQQSLKTSITSATQVG